MLVKKLIKDGVSFLKVRLSMNWSLELANTPGSGEVREGLES